MIGILHWRVSNPDGRCSMSCEGWGGRHQTTTIMHTPQELNLYGPFIQVGAIIVSAIGVVWTISRNTRIARRRATLDLLINEQTHETTIKYRTDFEAIREGGNVLQWVAPANLKICQIEIIRSSLNRHELLAIGIRGRALNSKIYKRWFRTGLVRRLDIIQSPYRSRKEVNGKSEALLRVRVACEAMG